MLQEKLREKLQNRLVDITCQIQRTEDDKKTQMSAIAELIKTLKRRQNAISRAIKDDTEDELIAAFGDHYANELGVK